jgi:DNA-binding IclR family transcriptional regulator
VLLPIGRGASGLVLQAFSGAEGPGNDWIRATGYCYSKGERDPDVAAVSVPVLDARGSLRGALSVSDLLTRLSDAQLEHTLEVLRRASAELGARLPA